MKIAVPKEILPGERRVALTPETVTKLVAAGHAVVVESHAGERAGYDDEKYRTAGATIAPSTAETYAGAQIVAKVQRPVRADANGKHEAELIPAGALLVGLLKPHADPDTVKLYADRGIWAFSLELLPRITRAQAMDVNSSQ